MPAEKFKRKLAAILSADVKGYSRLMGADEEATLRTLQEYKEVMASSIQHHRGRIVGSAGDSVLAEFASVVDAVHCAVEIQQVLRAKNALLPEPRRMEFRIGINLGDVIEEEDTIYGDGVNIAARLEGMAEAGGICISESAYQQIKNKLPLRYDYLGEHEVKNIAEPVRVYRAQIESEAVARKSVEVASEDKMAFPLPDKPSIAVLPFVNMSDDLKQEFLCDGMTEDIITALTKVPNIVVISRQSTFTYKGKPVKVKQVSEELGVRYVLEGSFQRSGGRIRITAQLVDVLTGYHLWAERYDRDMKDIFALQDEITIKILTGVQKTLGVGPEVFRIEKLAEKYYRGEQGLNCYLKLLQAYNTMVIGKIENTKLARQMAEEAIAMCPENPVGYLCLGRACMSEYNQGNTNPQETLEKGMELAQKALAIEDTIANAHSLLCEIYIVKRDHDKAVAEGERAVALDPGAWTGLLSYANSLNFAGRPEEAIPLYQKAIRLNPFGSNLYHTYGVTLRNTGRFEEAVSAEKKAVQLGPEYLAARAGLAVTYILMGRGKEARAEAAEILRVNPKFSVDSWAKSFAYKDQSQQDKVINALPKAGLK